jgi:hypothetical protein
MNTKYMTDEELNQAKAELREMLEKRPARTPRPWSMRHAVILAIVNALLAWVLTAGTIYAFMVISKAVAP